MHGKLGTPAWTGLESLLETNRIQMKSSAGLALIEGLLLFALYTHFHRILLWKSCTKRSSRQAFEKLIATGLYIYYITIGIHDLILTARVAKQNCL